MNVEHIRKITASRTPSLVTSFAAPSLAHYEAFRGQHDRTNKRFIIEGGVLKNSNIDISWLPAAAETYDISADPDDYVLVDVPIVTVDIPNRNMQAFPFEEVSYFDPMHGRCIYKTFSGKPTHIDHQNRDPLKAKGVHFDSSLEYIPAYGLYKIRVLTGWDRTKDPYLVNQILKGERNGYSMGALVSAFCCSVCGATDTNVNPCRHMDPRLGAQKGSLWDMETDRVISAHEVSTMFSDPNMVTSELVEAAAKYRLVYQKCSDVNYIETSSVADPADPAAITHGSKAIWIP